MQLNNKVIVVTGGAKGIGLGIVKALAAEGALPVIIGRSEEDNLKVVASLEKNQMHSYQITAELASPEESRKAVREVVEATGRIDGLVNNAGLNDGVGLETGGYDQFMLSLHRSLVHYYLMAHHALPELIKTNGCILNITSKTADTGQGNTSGYAAANGGRNALTREWAVELLPYNIRVNAISVAECWTPQYQSWIQSLPDPQRNLTDITSRIPLGKRMTTTEEIAAMAVFLLSPRSSHTTGQVIHVDGGYVHLDRRIE